ncbi:MAG: response regulator, partial [Candidatus Eisenbacteria bacterium]|nr:response regulator [Candidatus Eisenbacteria bacterium]
MDADHVGARILVIDDDPNICRALEFSLKSQGYEVQIAHSAHSALEVIEAWIPDLFVMDVKLPDIDGLSLLSNLREDARFSTIPVILLTALRTDLASKVQGLRLGASDYMIKPFSLDELLARVATNLRMARLAQQLEEM